MKAIPDDQWKRIAAVVRAAAAGPTPFDPRCCPTCEAVAALTPDDIEAVQP